MRPWIGTWRTSGEQSIFSCRPQDVEFHSTLHHKFQLCYHLEKVSENIFFQSVNLALLGLQFKSKRDRLFPGLSWLINAAGFVQSWFSSCFLILLLHFSCHSLSALQPQQKALLLLVIIYLLSSLTHACQCPFCLLVLILCKLSSSLREEGTQAFASSFSYMLT